MAGYIIPIGTGREENWRLGRDNGIWALRTHFDVAAGDELFYWQAKSGLVARAIATTEVSGVIPSDQLPWPDHEEMQYKWKFGIRLLDEPESPVERQWSTVQRMLGSKTAANKPAIRIDANRIEPFIQLFEETDSNKTSGAGASDHNLSDITESDAVWGAIAEFFELGRDLFLAKYKLERSRDYFVLVGEELVDSKPILAVAHRFQYPNLGILPVSRFSGGIDGANRTLVRLGFTTATRAQIRPPKLGDAYDNRTALQGAYGGDKVSGITRFPGDSVVNLFSDEEGPYADDPPNLVEPFGYRGEGLNGPQNLHSRGNARLEEARNSRDPVRFWYRPRGEQFSFLAFVIVTGRAWVTGVGEDKNLRTEIEWKLATLPGTGDQIPSDLVELLDESDATIEDDPTAPEAKTATTYADLTARVEALGNAKRPTGIVRTNYPRSAAARRAVILRSNGQCESERCTGTPADLNRQGKPILDVDHIKDLGLGGEDHPRNMVALCPNCHACKTRGANARRWRSELARTAASAHNIALAEMKKPGGGPGPSRPH